MPQVDGVLLDIDGVLATSWEPIPGAVETIAWLRAEGVPFRLITNTTTHTRHALAATLGAGGFDITADEIVTAVTATATYLRSRHANATVFVLSDGDPSGDLDGITIGGIDVADVIVLGGANASFSYATMNQIFRRLMEGATLIGMHRNLFWRTTDGWELDGGAFLTGLETAAGVEATICGKPARAYFEAALTPMGVPAARSVMVGDDIVNDIAGGQAAGCRGVLVRTGKYRPGDEDRGTPDAALDSIAELPAWLRGEV